jgi:hypothetical protein
MGILRKKGGGDVYAKRLSSRGKTVSHDDVALRVGTLRSELDEPSNMPQAFEDLVTQAARAKLAYDNGEMTKAQYAMVLRGLRLVAPDGTEWTTGATSGTWYCRPVGGAWVRSTPPAEDKPSDMPVKPRVLPPREVVVPSPAVGVRSGESYQPAGVAGTLPTVTQSPSVSNPVSWESTAKVDEHGVWSGEWSAPERSRPSTDEDLLDEILRAAESVSSGTGLGLEVVDERPEERAPSETVADFDPFGSLPEEPRRSDGSGWAAWGISPESRDS